MDTEMRDVDSPVVIPQHVRSRPAVPDLCIAGSSLLSALDPFPLDRLSRHTVEEMALCPAADRHAILAVANRDVRIVRQNIAVALTEDRRAVTPPGA